MFYNIFWSKGLRYPKLINEYSRFLAISTRGRHPLEPSINVQRNLFVLQEKNDAHKKVLHLSHRQLVQ